MPFQYNAKIPRERMPAMAKTRSIRYRYPWADLEIGDGFEFAPTIKIMSARVMCTNNGRELGRVFRCYRGMDEKLYALRVAGMHTETPREPMAEVPRMRVETAPPPAEIYGDFGFQHGRQMPDNAKNIIDEPAPVSGTSAAERPSWLPPIPKTESQIKTEKILAERKANLAAMGERDDI